MLADLDDLDRWLAEDERRDRLGRVYTTGVGGVRGEPGRAQRRVLGALRKGPATAQDLAVAHGMDVEHVKSVLRRLQRRGLVQPIGRQPTRTGPGRCIWSKS